MIAAPTPSNENVRLSSLRKLKILDTPAEERFDRITRLARRALGAPIALVSLVDDGRQWFKSAQGVTLSETPRSISFCGHVIMGEGPMVVPDALQDERFTDNPLVTGEQGVRFYAGHPIRSPDGQRIGTLCVLDRQPRQLTDDDLEVLSDLAAMVEKELRFVELGESERDLRERLTDAERRASVDSLTRVWNREMILRLLAQEADRSQRSGVTLAIMIVDIDHFKAVNDTYGHPVGDAILSEIAARIRSSLRLYDSVGRYGGEEFLAVLPECSAEEARLVAERVRKRVCTDPIDFATGSVTCAVSIGFRADNVDGEPSTIASKMVAAADAALFSAKKQGRNRVVEAE